MANRSKGAAKKPRRVRLGDIKKGEGPNGTEYIFFPDTGGQACSLDDCGGGTVQLGAQNGKGAMTLSPYKVRALVRHLTAYL